VKTNSSASKKLIFRKSSNFDHIPRMGHPVYTFKKCSKEVISME
jgi:hypothetical protein